MTSDALGNIENALLSVRLSYAQKLKQCIKQQIVTRDNQKLMCQLVISV